MPYSYKEIPKLEHQTKIYEANHHFNPAFAVWMDNFTLKNQFEILDEGGDSIATVYSKVDAEVLVSHLNR